MSGKRKAAAPAKPGARAILDPAEKREAFAAIKERLQFGPERPAYGSRLKGAGKKVGARD